VKFVLDADHISVTRKQSNAEYAALMARIAQVSHTDLAFHIASFHTARFRDSS
jgi:hypothetical protein